MLVEQPVRASQASAAVATAPVISSSIPAQTGYSWVSHSNKVESTAWPLVAHWYRCWWVLTRPGVARQPRASIQRAPGGASGGGAGAGPTAGGREPAAARGPRPAPGRDPRR